MNNTAGTDPGFTEKVLKAYSNIEDARLLFIVAILIKNLHACIKEMKVTDEEWEFAWDFMRRMAEITGPERNEFLLFGDITGVSQLIETMNHEKPGQPVGYALVGPFYRASAPLRERGSSIASADTAGVRVRISGKVFDFQNNTPIKGAILDIWQAATNGFYENQDENQPDYNLRGRFSTDENGTFEFIALMPTAYPAPTDGPVGELLRAAKRSPYRPAHIHFIVAAQGYETLVTQVFVKGDRQIEEDVVFTAGENMVGDFQKEEDHFRLSYDFPLNPGVSKMPKAPIPDTTQNVSKLIVGTWRLVHSMIINADGKKEYPYGEDAIGYICYSSTGVMAVQISRKSRTGVKDPASLKHDYLAYFGRYETDADRQVVRHFVEGQLFPGPVVRERKYRFDGDFMLLVPVDRANREILWQRVRGVGSLLNRQML